MYVCTCWGLTFHQFATALLTVHWWSDDFMLRDISVTSFQDPEHVLLAVKSRPPSFAIISTPPTEVTINVREKNYKHHGGSCLYGLLERYFSENKNHSRGIKFTDRLASLTFITWCQFSLLHSCYKRLAVLWVFTLHCDCRFKLILRRTKDVTST